MIINGIKVKLKEVDAPSCDGCIFNNNGNCIADKPYCSVYTIYVKDDE